MTRKLLKLEGVKSPYTGEHYIGFVLDVLNEYLGWEVKQYYLAGCGALSGRCGAMMEAGKDRKIVVKKIRDGEYSVVGFPEDVDFEDFREKAPALLEKILSK